MKRSEKISCAAATILAYAAIFFFFAFKYKFHVINQEQLQLFEYTREYFLDTFLVPGGLADYVSRFLTQFFFHASSGAAILTLLMLCVQALTMSLCRNKSLLNHALSLMPVIFLTAMLCQRFSCINAAVSILFCLCALFLVLKIRKDCARRIAVLAAIPIMYYFTGPAVILVPLISMIKERKVWFSIASLVLAALSLFVAFSFLPFNFIRLLYGLSYYKMHFDTPIWPWAAIAATFAAVLSAEFIGRSPNIICGISTMIVVLAGGISLVSLVSNPSEEKELMYQIMTVKRAWTNVLSASINKAPDTYNDLACINLALCQTGHMGGHMFDYPQSGVEGLIPNTSASQHDRLFIGEIYYQLGLINNARRYAMEALAYVPDYQNSAPIFALLAEINIVDGHYVMAKKYLKTLTHTIFYRKWAAGMLSVFDDLTAPDAVNDYSKKRFNLNQNGRDYIFNYEDISSSLSQLVHERPDNITALNYLLAIDLLEKDLSLFTIHCPFKGYVSAVPKSYQEAFLQDWNNHGWPVEELPEFIEPEVAARSVSFMEDYNSGQSMDFMLRKYHNSYWTYYSFR